MEKLIINAALTGNIPTRDLSPYVPLSIEEIIKDAIDCANAGVTVDKQLPRAPAAKTMPLKRIMSLLLITMIAMCF